MQLDKYTRTTVLQPTPQTRSAPAGVRVPDKPNDAVPADPVTKEANIEAADYSTAGYGAIAQGIESIGRIGGKLFDHFKELNRRKEDAIAAESYHDVQAQFNREVRETDWVNLDGNYEDVLQKMMDKYETKLKKQTNDRQQAQLLPRLNRSMRNTANKVASGTSEALAKKEQKNLQSFLDTATDTASRDEAYATLIQDGLLTGAVSVDDFGFTGAAEDELKARLQHTKDSNDPKAWIDLRNWVMDKVDEDAQGNDLIDESQSILPVVDKEVALAKGKEEVKKYGDYNYAFKQLTQTDFMSHLSDENYEKLYKWTEQRAQDESTQIARRLKEADREVDRKMREFHENGALTMEVISENSDKMSRPTYSFWTNIWQASQEARSEEEADKQVTQAASVHSKYLNMAESGRITDPDSAIQDLRSYQKAYSSNPEAVDALGLDKLIPKIWANAKVGKDHVMYEKVDWLEDNQGISTKKAVDIKRKLDDYIYKQYVDQETGEPVDDPPSQEQVDAALLNILNEELDKAAYSKINNKVKQSLGSTGGDYTYSDFKSGVEDDYGTHTGGAGRFFANIANSASREKGLLFINNGGLIGREQKAEDEISNYRTKLASYYSNITGAEEGTDFAVDTNQLPGGVPVLISNGLSKDQYENLVDKMYTHREPTKKESDVLLNGGKMVMDVEGRGAGEGSGRSTLITMEEFTNKYPVFGGDDRRDYTGAVVNAEVNPQGEVTAGKIKVGGDWVDLQQMVKEERIGVITKEIAKKFLSQDKKLYGPGRTPEEHLSPMDYIGEKFIRHKTDSGNVKYFIVTPFNRGANR